MWNRVLNVLVTVRLSVTTQAQGSKLAAAGLLLWARQAGDTDRLLQRRRANAGSGTLSACVGRLG